jgi:hypothetical protein
MLGNEVIISHDSNYDEYYISDKEVCFILGPSGLSECPQIITSVLRGIDSKGDHLLLGITSPPSDLVELETDLFSSIKPIKEVELVGKNTEGLEVDVFSIIEGEGRIISSAVVDSFGKARVSGAGDKLSISISGEVRPDLHISAINVMFQDATKLGLKEFING